MRWLRDRRLVGWCLMLFGALAWLAGELIGVHSSRADDTTSEVVWRLQRLPWIGPVIRALVLAFVLSLAGHFMFHWSLIP